MIPSEEPTCPKCDSADWNPEQDEGGWPSCKTVLGYVPTLAEAIEKGFVKL